MVNDTREILFKAKRLDNGEWVEGYVFDDGFIDSTRRFIGNIIISDYKGNADGKWEILGTDFCEVNPETICQFTGLTDKNGKKIWENDICFALLVPTRKGFKDEKEICVIRYGRREENFKIELGFWLEWMKTNYWRTDIGFWTENRELEVIGNIFDNPELLKGGSE